jgi:GT2 family glycosyltransferase
MSGMADISVIIVNYGTADLAIDGVETILAGRHGGRSVDVHIVDNGSPGNDASLLRAAHFRRNWGARVILYLESANHGFGRGNNVALEALNKRETPPAYVFFLNPDARLSNEAIDSLATFLDAHPDAAAAGPAILRPDGTRVSSAFRFPSPLSEFVSAAGVSAISRLLPGKIVALPPDSGRQPVDWVTGAAFMVPFPLLVDTGFFDPDFFLYFEETELMWRLGGGGHTIWHVPEAQVVHVAGAATGMQGGRHVSRAQPGYWYDSWRLYHVKTRGVGAARLSALLCVAGVIINIGVSAVRRRSTTVPAHFFRDFWRHVLHPLFLGDPRLARPDGRTVGGSR